MAPRALEIEHLLQLAVSLLEIGSETGHESAIAELVAEHLASLRAHEVVRAGNSLCCVPRAPRRDAATLLLVGHLDTVPALEPNPVRREGERLCGLGASDMKAACAIILELLARAAEQEPRHDLVGVLYAREEGPFAASELPLLREAARAPFERAARSGLAVCMEPTDNALELGCLGTLHARVTFAGKRAHSARPWQGENAIHKAAPLLARLAALAPKEHLFDGLSFKEVISATMCEFRGARNVVPDRFTLNLNYRFAPGKDAAAVRADLDALIAGEASYEIVDFCPAGRVCAGNPLLDELRQALRALRSQGGGAEPPTRAKQAWTDVGRLSHWGIDAINFGPGDPAQAHQAGEWIAVPALERGLRALERWLFG